MGYRRRGAAGRVHPCLPSLVCRVGDNLTNDKEGRVSRTGPGPTPPPETPVLYVPPSPPVLKGHKIGKRSTSGYLYPETPDCLYPETPDCPLPPDRDPGSVRGPQDRGDSSPPSLEIFGCLFVSSPVPEYSRLCRCSALCGHCVFVCGCVCRRVARPRQSPFPRPRWVEQETSRPTPRPTYVSCVVHMCESRTVLAHSWVPMYPTCASHEVLPTLVPPPPSPRDSGPVRALVGVPCAPRVHPSYQRPRTRPSCVNRFLYVFCGRRSVVRSCVCLSSVVRPCSILHLLRIFPVSSGNL